MIDGLVSLLRDEPRLEISGTCTSGAAALAWLQEQEGQIDILISDVSMPLMSGLELTLKVKELYPEIQVIILTMHADNSLITDVFKAGASGYLLKNTGKQELLEAIERVKMGQRYYSPAVSEILLESRNHSEGPSDGLPIHLTERELEIMQLIAKERSNQEIADQLFISERTVETHRKNIFRKLDTKSVVGVIKFMAKHNLLIKD